MFKVIVSIISSVSLCLLFILLNTTTPATAGPFGILIIFIFAYLLSLGVMAFFLYGISCLLSHISKLFVPRRPFESLSFRKSYFFSTILAAIPIMLIGLRSVGEVSFYDYILVTFFAIIGCLYISKRIS